MCGIIAYVGTKSAKDVLLTGLKRMEYRGYDSAGIATFETNGKVLVTKSSGKVAVLEAKLQDILHEGTIGIGHTRWATHGAPTDENSHPHTVGKITLVHNGIVENYLEIKATLTKGGYKFASETDTEVLAALIDNCYKKTKDIAVCFGTALAQVRGTFGLAVLIEDLPGMIVVARRSSPVLIAQANGAVFVASDQYALTGSAKNAVVLKDEEIAICTSDSVEVIALDEHIQKDEVVSLQNQTSSVDLGNFDHYMQKEIFEQPESVARTMSGRINDAQKTGLLGGLNLTNKQLRGVKSLLLVGCGTAYNAGLTAKYLLEPLIKIPINVEVASELRYRNSPFTGGELAIAMSQSGETADTIACVSELQLKGITVLGIVNVVGSTLARMVDGGIYTHAGPEISVASTKAFSSQVTALLILGLHLARQRDMNINEGAVVVDQLKKIPEIISQTLALDKEIAVTVSSMKNSKHAMVLGRDTLYPIAVETALKIKEVTYMPTCGYAAGEMKHGPIALLAKDMTAVFLLARGHIYEKSLSNLAEVRARNPNVIVLTDSEDYQAQKGEQFVRLPFAGNLLQPLVFATAGQLLTYHLAMMLGREIDKPRNLAKSVTVE